MPYPQSTLQPPPPPPFTSSQSQALVYNCETQQLRSTAMLMDRNVWYPLWSIGSRSCDQPLPTEEAGEQDDWHYAELLTVVDHLVSCVKINDGCCYRVAWEINKRCQRGFSFSFNKGTSLHRVQSDGIRTVKKGFIFWKLLQHIAFEMRKWCLRLKCWLLAQVYVD